MKYLVMERHIGYVILLDEQGRFLRAADRGYEVGQTVVTPLLLGGKQRFLPRMTALRTTAAVIAAGLLLAVGIGVWQTWFAVFTTVHLTINPDLRIELNRGGDVLRITGLNADGEDLLAGYDWKDKDRRIVTQELIERAIDMDYLHEGDTVTLDVDTKDDAIRAEYSAELVSRIERAADGKVTIAIEVIGDPAPLPEDSETASSTSAPPPDTASQTTTPPVTEHEITKEEALDIALRHAGLIELVYELDDCEREKDDGKVYYEIDFHTARHEYEYKIDAFTGEILDHKCENRDD